MFGVWDLEFVWKTGESEGQFGAWDLEFKDRPLSNLPTGYYFGCGRRPALGR
jgi:hypothetical protein